MKNAWRSLGAGALILLVTVVAYLPALRGGFIWDDDAWTSGISGLLRDSSGLRLMWCKLSALQQYYPLTGTTFWLDYHLWGFWTLPYHVENVFLHASAAILFWVILRRLELPGAWLAGAIFALHPVMVESVAWITERKNVLSLVLYLTALLAYGRFIRSWKEEDSSASVTKRSRQRDWTAYALAFVLFMAAVLAKTIAFSLPAVVLLICWWKRGFIRWREDVLPSLPFFAFAIGLGLATAWLEQNHAGAKGSEWAILFPERCLIAGRAFWFYIGKLIWPANLCFVYPRWQLDVRSLRQWLYPITAVGALLGLWCARARIGRGPAAAAFFFVGTLSPFLGFMNVYFMRYSFVCDHWTYLSSLGLIALAAALITRAAEHFRTRSVLYGLAAVLLLVFTILTWRQEHIYRDVETLWRDTVKKNPGAWMAHNNLGIALNDQGKVPEAIGHWEQALRFKSDYAEAHNNLGNALVQAGRAPEALGHYEEALRIKPDFAEAQNNWGLALVGLGKRQDAIGHWEQALRIKPDFAEAHNNLGNALLGLGKVPEAIEHFEQALRLKPDHAKAHYNLANALFQTGKHEEAIGHWEQALRLNPDFAEAHYNLAAALDEAGRVQEAIGHYEQALRIKPDYAEAQDRLTRLGTAQ